MIDAPAPPPDAPTDDPWRGPARHHDRRRGRGHRALRTIWWLLLAGWVGLGTWHMFKPLPPGLHVAGDWQPVPADEIRPLIDLTTADAYGQPIVQQQIFDESLRLIADARHFVVLDQFLFNNHQGLSGTDAGETLPMTPLRPLSQQLTEALLAARRAHPALRILFITDPINDVYGGAPSSQLDLLEAAGVEIVRTDLDRLRDSNPVWSGLWRLAIDWWDGRAGGAGWLPHPFDAGAAPVGFRAWARLLNFKANHRKILIADDGSSPRSLVGIVSSANPHDASSGHSNLALEIRGEALRPLLESELEIARFSGWRGPALPPDPAAAASPAAPVAAAVHSARDASAPVPVPSSMPAPVSVSASTPASPSTSTVRARVLTEGAIQDSLLEQLAAARAGERIDIAMFYLSDRDLIEALLAAARRGVELRLLLDPNKDAFGRAKSGLPNRPVASELVSRSDGAIKVRWYRTHGEQFHPKLVMVRAGDRSWLTLGSANLTRRNLGDYNLEANLAIEAASSTALVQALDHWFETLWSNRAPAGIEYTADFGTFADPRQSSYWAYRIMEATGLSTF